MNEPIAAMQHQIIETQSAEIIALRAQVQELQGEIQILNADIAAYDVLARTQKRTLIEYRDKLVELEAQLAAAKRYWSNLSDEERDFLAQAQRWTPVANKVIVCDCGEPACETELTVDWEGCGLQLEDVDGLLVSIQLAANYRLCEKEAEGENPNRV